MGMFNSCFGMEASHVCSLFVHCLFTVCSLLTLWMSVASGEFPAFVPKHELIMEEQLQNCACAKVCIV